jgi:hypothetical protein
LSDITSRLQYYVKVKLRGRGVPTTTNNSRAMALTLERFSVVLLAANLFVLVRADDYDYDYDECGNQGYGDIDHTAFVVSLFIVLPIIMCVFCCSCCSFCTVAWLVTCLYPPLGCRRSNNDPTIVEVIDPELELLSLKMPPDGIDLPPPYSLAASPSAPPPLTPDSQVVDHKQEPVGDIDHEKED